MKKKYVVGFLIHKNGWVLLLQKTHPDYLAGKWNGVGGKIEEGESSLEAMRREFKEEAGLDFSAWDLFARLHTNRADIDCFVGYYDGDTNDIKTMTDEPVQWFVEHFIDQLDLVPNVKWLLPMTKDVSSRVYDVQFHTN